MNDEEIAAFCKRNGLHEDEMSEFVRESFRRESIGDICLRLGIDKGNGFCICCGHEGTISIALAVGSDGEDGGPRFLIPNHQVRCEQTDVIHEVAFCNFCMREVEDAMRGAIRRLQNTPYPHAEKKKAAGKKKEEERLAIIRRPCRPLHF